MMNEDLGVKLQQLEEQIRVNDHNVQVLREQSAKVERESNAHQSSISLKDNDIRDLNRINQSKVTEMNILCDQITQLKLSCVGEVKNVYSVFQSMIKQNFGTNILLRLIITLAPYHLQIQSKFNLKCCHLHNPNSSAKLSAMRLFGEYFFHLSFTKPTNRHMCIHHSNVLLFL